MPYQGYARRNLAGQAFGPAYLTGQRQRVEQDNAVLDQAIRDSIGGLPPDAKPDEVNAAINSGLAKAPGGGQALLRLRSGQVTADRRATAADAIAQGRLKNERELGEMRVNNAARIATIRAGQRTGAGSRGGREPLGSSDVQMLNRIHSELGLTGEAAFAKLQQIKAAAAAGRDPALALTQAGMQGGLRPSQIPGLLDTYEEVQRRMAASRNPQAATPAAPAGPAPSGAPVVSGTTDGVGWRLEE